MFLGLGLAINRPASSQFPFTNSEASALVSRMTVQPTNARKALIDNLVGSLKTASVWSKLDCLYLLAAHDAQAARLNWKGSSFTLSGVNSPTFSTDQGYAGDGSTSYLETSFNLSSSGGVFAQDSAEIGLWSRTSAQNANSAMGTTNNVIVPRSASDTVVYRMTQSAATAAPNSDGSGHYCASRTASNLTTMYKNGSSLGTSATASAALENLTIRICGRSGTAQFTTIQIAAAHVGSGLNSTEVASLYSALSTYLTAVGAA